MSIASFGVCACVGFGVGNIPNTRGGVSSQMAQITNTIDQRKINLLEAEIKQLTTIRNNLSASRCGTLTTS